MSDPITTAPAVDVSALQAQVASLLAENADLKLRAAGATAGLVPQSYLDAVNADLAKTKDQLATLQAQPAAAAAEPDPAVQQALSSAHDMLIAAQQKQNEDAATIASLQAQIAAAPTAPADDTSALQAQIADLQSKLKQAGDVIAQNNDAAMSAKSNLDAAHAQIAQAQAMAEEYKAHAEELEKQLDSALSKADVAPSDPPTVRLIAPDIEVVTLSGVIDVRLSADGGQTLYRVLQTTTQDGFHRAASPAIAQVLNGNQTTTPAPSGVGAAV